MEQATKTRNEPVWDKANSTFMRNIHFANGYVFTGYSKKYQNNERRDKIDLLTNWILRDFKNGYLDKNSQNPKITETDRIEYFIRKGTDFVPVINLYYDFAEWPDQSWMDNRKFFSFIFRFYEMQRKGTPVPSIINALEVRTRAPKLDPFFLDTPRFSHINDLNAYVFRLRNEGKFPKEEIENFYRKYKEKYFKK
jgi:hypothetical protein